MDFPFSVIVSLVGGLAGAIASVAGFGIGSLLTPLLAVHLDTKLAVAAVSIPHFIGTAIRCFMLRKEIDRKVLLSFGITSALGGLIGALIHNSIQTASLTLIFGIILVFAGLMGATGANERLRFKGWVAWLAGAISGGLGGLVGNQGGIRSAALLGFNLNKTAFVATATAIGLFVDLARMPVYFFYEFKSLTQIGPLVTNATLGVIVGTIAGAFFLKAIDERIFKRVVSVIIFLLGLWMLLQNWGRL